MSDALQAVKRMIGFRGVVPMVSRRDPMPVIADFKTFEDWMRASVAHFQRHHPDDVHALFSPACGDYMPLKIHAHRCFGPDELVAYRRVKEDHPEAVEEAKRITNGIAGRVCLSRVGDVQDYRDDGEWPL